MIQFNRFVTQVSDGTLPTSRRIKQAVDRHLKDLKKSKKKDFPYYFDEDIAQKYINAVKLFKHWKAPFENQPFNLKDFQAFIIGSITGWLRKSNNYRRYTKSYTQVPKKNGKTELAAVLANVMLLWDDESGAEIYMAATSREQAGICFYSSKMLMRNLTKDSPKANERIRVMANAITYERKASFIRAVSSEAGNVEGKGTHFGVVDEYHLARDTELIDNLESGMAGRTQPHLFVITTPGFNLNSPSYEFYEKCCKILDGTLEEDNLFIMIFELVVDEGENEDEVISNRDNWAIANPNIGDSPRWEFLESQFRKAKNSGGTAMVDFKTKHLGMWCSSRSTWIDPAKWRSCYNPGITYDRLRCEIGLDLATSKDITSLVLVFPPETSEDKYQILPYFFIPSSKIDDLKGRSDGVDYLKWVDEGHIIMTSGNVTDYRYIKNHILDLREKYEFAINYDDWNSSQLIIELEELGATCYPVSQSFKKLNPPTRQFERLIEDKQIEHDGNPVLSWMLSNVQIHQDLAGNIRPSKKLSTAKIDGIMATIMGISGTMSADDQSEITVEDLGIAEIYADELY